MTQNGGTTTTQFIGSLYETTTSTTSSASLGAPGQARDTRYVFLGDSRVASVSGAQTLYYHDDHLGGTNVLTDGTGALKEVIEYEPFGTESRHDRYGSSAEVALYYFTGQRKDDETGLYFYNARYYDPVLGRFIQADTIVQSPSNPQTLNRYTYCNNNPVNYTDPDGHFWFIPLIIAAIKGAIVGAIIGGAVAAATGGNIGQGFATGAIGGAIFGGVGNIIGGMGWGVLGATAAHAAGGAVSGAISSVITGGDPVIGALVGGLSAGAAKFVGSSVSFLKDSTSNTLGAFAGNSIKWAVIGAVIGGATSSALGGSFGSGAAQGAITAGIAFLANDSLHRGGYLNGKFSLALDKFYNAVNWLVFESVLPGANGQPASEWKNGQSTGWGDPMKYTERAGGAEMWEERTAVGLTVVATAGAVGVLAWESSGGTAIWKGGEFVFSKGGQVNLRISPFGHRGGDWSRQLPHYHSRGPGGIGEHRPWEGGRF